MGFFRYDLFPYVVCLEIEKFDERGRAYVHQVGWYRPDQLLTIRPIKSGQALKEVIETISREHRKRQEEITHELAIKIEDMLGVKLKR